MVQKDAIHQMIKFNQTLFDSAFEATVKFQDQVEKLGNAMMDKAAWLPSENRKVLDNCVEAYKAGRSNFKSYVDEGYQQTEKLLK